jgi:hypothetical protein
LEFCDFILYGFSQIDERNLVESIVGKIQERKILYAQPAVSPPCVLA